MEKHKILHVSVLEKGEVKSILDDMNERENFYLEEVSFSEFASLFWRSLKDYHVIVFGISDAYEYHISDLSQEAIAGIKKFVNDGGGIIWTHDTLAKFKELYEMSGFKASTPGKAIGMFSDGIRILNPGHDIIQGPYPTSKRSRIEKKTSHSSGSFSHTPVGMQVQNAEIIIDHNSESSGVNNFYLTSYNFGKGRVVALEIGHAEFERFGGFEKAIFINSLYWVCGFFLKSYGKDTKLIRSMSTENRANRRIERLLLSISLTVGIASLLLHFLDFKDILYVIVNFCISFSAGIFVWILTGKTK
ncbi:MAG: DUF5057 domain-containing protein [Candidatus Aminicenantes bacterium]|nr:MAG: DUF5057 domain-containing protein [Candidatus Aminicenantes bacterium]